MHVRVREIVHKSQSVCERECVRESVRESA